MSPMGLGLKMHMLSASGGPPTMMVIQNTQGDAGSGNTLPYQVVAGDTIVVVAVGWSGTITSVSDNEGQDYTQLINHAGTNANVGVWYHVAVQTGSLTITMNGATSGDVSLYDIFSPNGPIVPDKVMTADGSTSSISIGPINTSYDNSIIMAAAYIGNNTPASGTSGWVLFDQFSSFSEYQVSNKKKSFTATGSESSLVAWSGVICSFTDQINNPSSIMMRQMGNTSTQTSGDPFNGTVTKGSMIAMTTIKVLSGTITGVSDNLGTQYTVVGGYTSSSGKYQALAYGIAGASGDISISWTVSSGASFDEYLAWEINSSSGPVYFDHTTNNADTSGATANVNCGTITTTYNNTFICAQAWLANNMNTGAGGNWYPFLGEVGGNFAEWIIPGAKGTYAALGTQTATGEYDGIVGSFTDRT